MSVSRRLWTLAAALLTLAPVVQAHSMAVNESLTCPATSRDDDQEPMLINNCESICGYKGFCVFYPYKHQDACYGLFDSRCLQGDTCIFECFRQGPDTVYFYRDWDQVADWTANFALNGGKSAMVNASLIPRWSSDDLSNMESYRLTGGLTIYDVPNYDEGPYIPPVETVQVEVPDNIYSAKWKSTGFAIVSVKCPKFPSKAQVYSDLTTLWLENCGLTEFPWGESTAPSLQKLFLAKNHLKELANVPPSVRWIDLSGNQLTAIPPSFKNLENLYSVHLRHNPLGNIDAKDLSASLQGVLILKNCSMTQLPANLDHLVNLRELSVSYNNLGDIDTSKLPPALRTLQVANCGLTSVPKFSEDSSLSAIDLSGNAIPGDALSELPSTIARLVFRDAGLKRIPPAVASKFTTFTSLDLANNPIEKIERGELPDELDILVINNAPLKSSDIAENALPKRLTTVNITNCQLEEVPNSLVSNSTNVQKQYLNLANNKLKRYNGALATRLFLQHNELKEFESEGQNVKYLDLSFNKLTTFKLTDAENLKVLILRGNKFTTIPELLIELRTLEVLDLRDNPITDYVPTSQEWDFFKRIPVVLMDASQLRSNCKEIVRFKANWVCDPDGSLEPLDSSSSSSGSSISDSRKPRSTKASSSFGEKEPTKSEDTTSTPRRKKILVSSSSGSMEEIVEYSSWSSSSSSSSSSSLLMSGTLETGEMKPGGSRTNGSDKSKDTPPGYHSDKKAFMATSISTVAIAVILVGFTIMVFVMWYRDRKHTRSSRPYTADFVTDSTLTSENQDIMLWYDDELMRHRLDPKTVQVKRFLAAGTYGEVFLAKHQGQPVVVKRLKNRDSSRAETQQFVSEIKMMANFQFPKIVRFVGVVWTKESDIAVVTEYMENGDLRTHLSDTKRKARDGWTAQKYSIALDIAEALVYLHSLNPPLIHRDLKSSNVLLDKDMSACLSDFGTTRPVDEANTMTAEVGTVLWMAPEVLNGRRYDQSADVYSLGVILSELDTHELPFHGDESETAPSSDATYIMSLVVSGSMRVNFLSSCPPEIVSLSTRCTALDPGNRPSTLQVAYELRNILRQSQKQKKMDTDPK